MGDYHDYDIKTKDQDEVVTGICHARNSNEKLPPQWLMYVYVEDVNESSNKCVRLGGKIVDGPRKMGDSDFCVIEDPAGAVIGLMSLSREK